MYLAVPLSWSLSLVRPVTLRPDLSVGLPFHSYLAALSASALLPRDSRDRGAQVRKVPENLARNCLSAAVGKTLVSAVRIPPLAESRYQARTKSVY